MNRAYIALFAAGLAPPPANAQTSPVAGCYELRWGGPPSADTLYYRPPPVIHLVDAPPGEGLRRIEVPNGSVPSPHRSATWSTVGDTVRMSWSTGFIGVQARMTESPEGLTGTMSPFTDVAGSRWPVTPLEAIRFECGAANLYPIESMRRFRRAVQLTNGDSLTLGLPLPPGVVPDSSRSFRTELSVALAPPFSQARRVSVSLREGGVVGSISISIPGLDDPQSLLDLFVSTYGAWNAVDHYDDHRGWVWSGRAESMTIAFTPASGTRIGLHDPRIAR